MADSNKKPLRSQAWFGLQDRDGFLHRSWMKNQGIPHDNFDGRPVIGICNTWSELTPCNAHFRELAEYVKKGVREAGGLPLEFPVMSLGETNLRPTAMLFRNLASMDVEESIRGNPMDGVILLVGCDKTTPALLMGAASCNLPALAVSGGPMLNGKFRGKNIGSGTGVWQMSEEVRAGTMTQEEFTEAESCMNRSRGHCMTMGTASTMASMVESLGMGLPHNAAIPAVDARRQVLAHMAGRRIVDMVREDLTMDKILTREAFENAIRTNAAIGGSTNAVIHLIALAKRIGVELNLADWELGSDVPCLVNLQPSGEFLMEDFYYAGGLPAVLRQLGEQGLLHKDALTVNGKSIWDNVNNAPNYDEKVITTFEAPFKPKAGIAVLKGNLAPNGAVIKPSAATAKLLKHRGRAVVFETIEELHEKIDDEVARYRRELRDGAQGRGAEGLSGLCGSRQHAAAEEGAAKGHHRHGPHFRWPHERHGLRRGGAARVAGSGGGRAARVRADGRHDRTRCRGAAAASGSVGRRTRTAAACVAKARQPGARLLQALRRSRPASGPGRRPRFSGRFQRRTGAARFALIAFQIEWTKVLADAIMNRIGFFIAKSNAESNALIARLIAR